MNPCFECVFWVRKISMELTCFSTPKSLLYLLVFFSYCKSLICCSIFFETWWINCRNFPDDAHRGGTTLALWHHSTSLLRLQRFKRFIQLDPSWGCTNISNLQNHKTSFLQKKTWENHGGNTKLVAFQLWYFSNFIRFCCQFQRFDNSDTLGKKHVKMANQVMTYHLHV